MSNLVIVESPSKAKTIEKYLGKDYKVVATVGHVIDLPKSKLGVDVEKGYEPEFTTIKGKGALLKKLRKQISDKDNVYLAMDPDREGEAIAWHVANSLKLKNPKRAVFHEITKTAVNEAIKKPRKISKDLVDAQISRRVLDRLVGYKLSELLWQKIWYGLSAGRVQSVALRLIVEREKEIEAFVPDEFWDIQAVSEDNEGNDLVSKLSKKDGKKYQPVNKKEAEALESDILGETLEVIGVKVRDVSKNPYPPYTTSTLQQAANNRLGYTAKRTMQLAQKLYQAGLITYMRTDSVTLSRQAIDAVRKEIQQKHGDKYLPKESRGYKTKSRMAQEAHEAIRPTDFAVDKAYVQGKFGAAEAKLYELIKRRAVSSQMEARKSKVFTVSLEVTGKSGSKYQFTLGGEKVLFDGFTKVLGWSRENEDIQQIESVNEGDKFKVKEVKKEQKFTKPKPRYTDASLVKALEEYGVGRPSTYATIISTVVDRGYVTKEGRSLKPLDVGRVVSDFLSKYFDRLVDYEYTAGVEEKLDMITENKVEYEPFIDGEYKPLMKEIESAKEKVDKEDVVILGDSDEKCEKCGADMVVRLGRYGKFLSCSTFPKCKGMKSLEESTEEIDEEKYLIPEKCPECGAKMMFKTGKYGKFWACERYPDCKGTVPMLLQEKCPESGHPLVERQGKWGKSFIGCSGYPDCKYIKKTKKKRKKSKSSSE